MRAPRTITLVVLAIAAAAPGRARTEPERVADAAGGPRRALLDACSDGRADACRELGERALAGSGEPRDDRLGATYLLWACDRGDRAACGGLAALYAAGIGVRRDASRAAALARVAGVDPPPLRRADPGPRARPPLEEMSGAALERQLELVEVFVPETVREALALGRDRIASEGLAPTEDRILIETLVRERVPSLSECVVDAVRRTAGVGWVSFVIDEGGRAAEVRVNASGAPTGAEACLRTHVERFEFPLPRRSSGGLVWFEVVGTLPRERAGGSRPVAGRRPPPGRPPALEDSGCVRDSLWVRPGERQSQPVQALVRFHVGAEGDVSEVHFLTPVPLGTARALRRAVRECAWTPARDPKGRRVSAWAILPVQIGG